MKGVLIEADVFKKVARDDDNWKNAKKVATNCAWCHREGGGNLFYLKAAINHLDRGFCGSCVRKKYHHRWADEFIFPVRIDLDKLSSDSHYYVVGRCGTIEDPFITIPRSVYKVAQIVLPKTIPKNGDYSPICRGCGWRIPHTERYMLLQGDWEGRDPERPVGYESKEPATVPVCDGCYTQDQEEGIELLGSTFYVDVAIRGND